MAADHDCLVISPHLDDAVFGCGDWIASRGNAIVVTVFAGVPDAACATPWDVACGFGNGVEAVVARRAEDRCALGIIDARPQWLDFLDGQYGARPAVVDIVGAVACAIAETRATVIVFPMGLFHSDHRLVSEAMLALRGTRTDLDWLCYADALYRFIPGLCQQRRADLTKRGVRFVPIGDMGAASVRKHRAIACYASQLRALARPGHVPLEAVYRRERLWRLEFAGG